jgi:hypothetical protein
MTTVTQSTIADGDLGVAQTVAAMAGLVRSSIATPIVRQSVAQILTSIEPGDYLGQAYAVREWLSQHITFLRDPAGVELLHTPEWLIRAIFMSGTAKVDCDDVAILAAALMGAIGWRVAFVTVAFLDNAPFSHIYCSSSPPVAFLDSGGEQIWIEFDITRPMQEIPVNFISRSQTYPVL